MNSDSSKNEVVPETSVEAADPAATSEPNRESLDPETETAVEPEVSPAAAKWQSITDQRQKKKHRPFWIELPILLVVAFIMTFLIQTFFFKVYYIPSGSMEQTLHGVANGGDRVLVNKIVFDFSDPEPGEVVVFSGPPTWAAEASIPGPGTWYGQFFQAVGSVVGIAPPNEKDFVKRVIATAGQTVECCDAQGRLMVDGKPLIEPYIYEDFVFTVGTLDCGTPIRSQRCFGPVTVPVDSLWVMGDHRSNSRDSAYGCRTPGGVCQGPIPVANVIGKAFLIVMPVSRWQTIDSPNIQGGTG